MRELAAVSPSTLALRLLVLLMPFVVLLAGSLGDAKVTGPVVLLVALGAVASAGLPGSHAGSVTLALLVGFWLLAGPARSGFPVLLAAAAVVVFHVAALLASHGPATLRLDVGSARRWAGRAVLLYAAAVVAWGAARLASPSDVSVALALLVLAVVSWVGFTRAALVTPGGR